LFISGEMDPDASPATDPQRASDPLANPPFRRTSPAVWDGCQGSCLGPGIRTVPADRDRASDRSAGPGDLPTRISRDLDLFVSRH